MFAVSTTGAFGLHVAYLINCYPAPSHSFIRREIDAVRAAGIDVTAYSIRPAPTILPDRRDEFERTRTITVLTAGVPAILGSLIIEVIRQPLGFCRALRCAGRMAGASLRDAWRQIAYLAEAAWLKRQWRAKNIAHVHVHFGTNPTAVARLAHAWGGPVYSFTVHGPDEFDAPGAIDLGGKIADSVFVAAISSFGRSQLMRWAAPTDWPKIDVVRCGLDDDFLSAEISDPPDTATLCCVARLGPQKGLHVLVDAVALVARERPDVQIVIVGDGPLRGALEAQAAIRGIAANISFAGMASSDAVGQHLVDARAFVLPSFAEGLPVVLMEALALGRPVITTWVAGIPELIDEEVGWLCAPGDIAALASAIRAALDAPVARLAQMGRTGRARVTSMHDARASGAQLAALIRADVA